MSARSFSRILTATVAAAAFAALAGSAARADPLGYQASIGPAGPILDPLLREPGAFAGVDANDEIATHLRRRTVSYPGNEAAGTIVIDTPNTYLYFILGRGAAIRYGIGVGREGFAWSGVKAVDHKSEWPDWVPPAEMIERQPYLPRFMAGGPGNPLGARAIYLGGTLYRIHGTNAPLTIGKRVSSGCIRMLNEDVIDLYARVNPGTRVVVLPMLPATGSNVAARSHTVPNPVSAGVTVRAFGIY